MRGILLLALVVLGFCVEEETLYYGFKDFWPVRLGRGQYENDSVVITRAAEFFAQRNLTVRDIDYFQFNIEELLDVNQTIYNAPSVSNPIDERFRESVVVVSRYTFTTSSRAVVDSVVLQMPSAAGNLAQSILITAICLLLSL